MINVDLGIWPLEVHVLAEKTSAGRATLLPVAGIEYISTRMYSIIYQVVGSFSFENCLKSSSNLILKSIVNC